MRSFKHWTPRYILNRLALMHYEHKYPESPWLTQSMIKILDNWLHPTDVGLEFGSGHSTLWFSRRVAHLTSVEHDPVWYTKVNQKLCTPKDNLGKVSYHLCEDGVKAGENSTYVTVARKIAPNSLDFVLIDGVARSYCAMASIDKLKPTGILIIDNINWYLPMPGIQKSYAPCSCKKNEYISEDWRTVEYALQDWRCVWTSNGVTDTAFWVKPTGA